MYRIEITNYSGYSFKVKSSNYDLVIDAKDKGITPPDMLLASLGSCIGVYLRKYCEGSNIAISDFSITVEADFSREKPVCFRQINVCIDLKGMQIDEHRKEALLAFIKNCPVHNTLEINPRVEVRII